MPKSSPQKEVTVDQAREILSEVGVTTRQGVQRMIDAGELAGARKLDPDKETSPWLIPAEAVEAAKQQRRKGTGPLKSK